MSRKVIHENKNNDVKKIKNTLSEYFDKYENKDANMKRIKGTLAEYLRSHSEVVFYGIQKGGKLNADISSAIVSSTPCVDNFSTLYTDHYMNECYITIVQNKTNQGPDAFFYQLDEKHGGDEYFYGNNGIGNGWRRQTGSGRLVSDNELAINETDGTVTRIIGSSLNGPGTVTLYRTRVSSNARGNHHPFDQSAYLDLSTPRRRNGTTKCCNDC